jgi:hypothetical protein
MLISLDKKFIFIHIYKVAGTSIRQALNEYSYDPRSELVNRIYNKFMRMVSANNENKILADHSNLQKFLLNRKADANAYAHTKAYEVEEINPEILNNFYTFAFVRNPWDWQVSLYHFMLKNKKHRFHEKIKELGSFYNYLNWLINENGFKLQSDFLLNLNKDKLLVDYVGRLETIEEDFNWLCQKLNLNASLPHQNQSQHKKYLELYDEESKQLVENAFQKDIQLLGYTFDSYDKKPVHKIIQNKLKSFNPNGYSFNPLR